MRATSLECPRSTNGAQCVAGGPRGRCAFCGRIPPAPHDENPERGIADPVPAAPVPRHDADGKHHPYDPTDPRTWNRDQLLIAVLYLQAHQSYASEVLAKADEVLRSHAKLELVVIEAPRKLS